MPMRFEDGLGYLVHHLMYAFRQMLSEQCAKSGYAITSDELAVLMITAQGQGETGLKQTDIADTLAKDKAVITRLVSSLLKKKLVIRAADCHDRRAVRVCLSAEGSDAVAHLRPQLELLLRKIYRDIDQQEFDITRDVLTRILNNVSSGSLSG
ncbi:MAG: MarR family winged helix-turn-helix transcriptional regulator [Mariprofundus sp.]|nr:MarR family winged helix-turn-helix transcriptional regulator [Mariprofundus sp.]